MADKRFDVLTRLTAKNLTKKAMRELNTSYALMLKNVGRINRAGVRTVAVGNKMRQSGRSMTIAGLAVAGSMAFAVKGAVDYERKFGRISTLLKDDAAGAMQKFGSVVDKITIETGGKLGDLQDAFFEAKSGGVALAEVTDFIRLAQKGAVGGFTDALTVTKALTKVMNAYKLNTNDAKKVLDQFFIANDVGQTTIGELGKSIGNVAGSMALFGANTGEMLSAIAVATKVLPSTEEAVVGLQGLLTSIRKPTQDAAKEIKFLNSTLDAGSKVDFSLGGFKKLGLLKFFQNVMKATGGNITSLEKLFGTNVRGFKILTALVQQQKTFIGTTLRMNKATTEGTLTNENFAKQTATMGFKLNVLKAKFAVFRKDIGFKLFPVLEQVIPKITNIIRKTTDWMARNKALVASIIGIGAKVVPILIGVGGITWALGVVTSTVGTTIKVFGGLKKAFFIFKVNKALIGLTAIKIMGVALAVGFAINRLMRLNQLAKEGSRLAAHADALKDSARIRNRLTEIEKINKKRRASGKSEFFQKQRTRLQTELAQVQTQIRFTNPIIGDAKSAIDKMIEEYKKAQSKITGIQEDALNKRRRQELEARRKSVGAGVDPIDIFARRRGRNLTEEIINGFGTRAIQGATEDRAQGGSKVWSIGELNLPNVTDRESMADELDRLSFQTGLAVG